MFASTSPPTPTNPCTPTPLVRIVAMASVPGSLPLELGAPFAIGVALDLWHWYRLHRSQQLWARLEAHSSSAMSLRPGTAGSAAVAAAIVAGAAAAGPVEPEPEPELGAQTESAPQAQCVVLVKRDGKNAVIGRQQSSPWALVVEARREATEPTKRTITLGEKTSASMARAFFWKDNSNTVSRQFPPPTGAGAGNADGFGVGSIRELEPGSLFEHDWFAPRPPLPSPSPQPYPHSMDFYVSVHPLLNRMSVLAPRLRAVRMDDGELNGASGWLKVSGPCDRSAATTSGQRAGDDEQRAAFFFHSVGTRYFSCPASR